MDWTRIRLCDLCGAGNPENATICIRCGGCDLGPPASPATEQKQVTVDLSLAPFAELCALLGIECVQGGFPMLPGLQILRDERGWREDEIWAAGGWYAWVMPSFDEWALAATVAFSESTFRGKHHPACLKAAAVVFTPGTDTGLISAVTEFDADLLRDALRAVDLMPEGQGAFLDGISYGVVTYGDEIRCRLNVSNPTRPGPLAIESAVVGTVERIQKATRNKPLGEYLKTLRRYRDQGL